MKPEAQGWAKAPKYDIFVANSRNGRKAYEVDTYPTEEKLISQHQGLVHSIAKKIAAQIPRVIDYEDLVAFGQEGLVQAVKRYDPKRGVLFSTFSYYRIRGAIFDGVRKMGPMIHVNHRVRFEERANEYLEQQASQPRPQSAIAAAERLAEMVSDLATAYVLTSRDISNEPDKSIPDPAQVTETHECMELIREHLDKLPKSERQLLQLMYYDGLTMIAAAQKLGISKGWASRLHARALTRLRRDTRAPPTHQPMIKI